jgi:hypothetical protein
LITRQTHNIMLARPRDVDHRLSQQNISQSHSIKHLMCNNQSPKQCVLGDQMLVLHVGKGVLGRQPLLVVLLLE